MYYLPDSRWPNKENRWDTSVNSWWNSAPKERPMIVTSDVKDNNKSYIIHLLVEVNLICDTVQALKFPREQIAPQRWTCMLTLSRGYKNILGIFLNFSNCQYTKQNIYKQHSRISASSCEMRSCLEKNGVICYSKSPWLPLAAHGLLTIDNMYQLNM